MAVKQMREKEIKLSQSAADEMQYMLPADLPADPISRSDQTGCLDTACCAEQTTLLLRQHCRNTATEGTMKMS
jgi:hypothetical protein